MSKDASPEQQTVPGSTPLTTPCSLNKLRNWLGALDAITPGKEGLVTISSGASSITVA
jgi:hypothetical protein